MADPFVAEIRIFPYNFAPKGWAWCNGQILSISQNTALFSLLGTMYGGNGQTTFALPNLQGKVPIQWGQGPGLSDRVIGEEGGSDSVTLLTTQIPAHTHGTVANNANANSYGHVNNFWAKGVPNTNPANTTRNYADTGPNAMAPAALSPQGGGQAHNNRQPTLAMYYNIALQGVYPSRS
jgi:microcystin-dependent protein